MVMRMNPLFILLTFAVGVMAGEKPYTVKSWQVNEDGEFVLLGCLERWK